MPSLILRDMPVEVHQRLRDRAARHHRSMTKEALDILDRELSASSEIHLPEPIGMGAPIPVDVINRAVDEGRE